MIPGLSEIIKPWFNLFEGYYDIIEVVIDFHAFYGHDVWYVFYKFINILLIRRRVHIK